MDAARNANRAAGLELFGTTMSPSTPNRSPKSMNKNQTLSKLADAEKESGKGLCETHCSAVVTVEFKCDECGKYEVIKLKSTLTQYCSSCGRLSKPSLVVSVGIKINGVWKIKFLPKSVQAVAPPTIHGTCPRRSEISGERRRSSTDAGSRR